MSASNWIGIGPSSASYDRPLRVVFECSELADGLRHLHPAEMGLPLVDARVTDPVLAAQVEDRHPGLVLLQDPDDLLFREQAAPHVLVLPMGQNRLQTGSARRGNVTGVDLFLAGSSPLDGGPCPPHLEQVYGSVAASLGDRSRAAATHHVRGPGVHEQLQEPETNTLGPRLCELTNKDPTFSCARARHWPACARYAPVWRLFVRDP